MGYYDEAETFKIPKQRELIVATKKQSAIITIDCGTTCQKVTQAGFGVVCAIVVVPSLILLLLLYGRGLWSIFNWALGPDRNGYGNPLADMGAFVGTFATVGVCVAIVVAIVSKK